VTTTGTARSGHRRHSRCRAGCRYGARAAWHHDQLLDADDNTESMLGLVELALTWHELDYPPGSVIEPSDWDEFLTTHQWHDRARAARIFSLAGDIVTRTQPTACANTEAPSAWSVYRALTAWATTPPRSAGPSRAR
jgi:hypothetical protein